MSRSPGIHADGLATKVLFAVLLGIAAAPLARGDMHLVVGTPQQGGAFSTIQAAVDAVPASTERYVIDILPGTYVGRVKILTGKPPITLRGHGAVASGTVITFNASTTPLPGQQNESTNFATVVVTAKDFIAENLTMANTYGTGGQALAIYAKGDRAVFNNVRFTGNQDTLRSELGRHYFVNSYVEGTVDFIYGKGTGYFENMVIYAKSSGYVTAQAREMETETSGYVFQNATVTGSAANGSVYLGRPWAAYSRSIFLNSKLGPMIKAAGWSTWSGVNHLTSYYAESNSMNLDGTPANVAGRVSWSHQLTAAEAAAYTKQAWLAGTDGWNPVVDTTTYAAPDLNRDGVVDGGDFLVWQRGNGFTGQGDNFQGDASGDGIVDAADLALLSEAYGAPASVDALAAIAAVVPEPAAGALGAAAIAVAATVVRVAAAGPRPN